ncbi:carbon-nitrogen hydrolase family protein [Desulfopila sp. IMCC35006]|uniref:carbon-nitrogen hydrolase family protein n=1 Tax=Desulfopila sp. IMCC35006 TaxID=2569542 RepID=UPI0010ABBF72|nr:carbon-nitrogen hydrolase family protein [Desulfopila sp. IMCC35006]TKB25479.1 carbon-nitrogen hydrolase family protein [Desulfopila sp. IMCC35006]
MIAGTSYRVAAVQMVSGADVSENITTTEHLVAEAAAQGARLIVLPENFAVMSNNEQDKIALAEEDGVGPLQDFLVTAARQHGIWLVGGTVPLVSDCPGKIRNVCLVYSPLGERIARYDKIHLFGFDNGQERYDESATVEAGDKVVTIAPEGIRTGLSICYDLRFPELFRAMGEVDLIVLPAAFTYPTGLAHWEVLLRARAIENQCYLIAAAQGGYHPSGRRTYGDSMIVDPWGEVLARRAEGPGVVIAEISSRHLQQIRLCLPALKDRRLL